jgi:NodT family efflux transporter outer membrane factor (OMF) lipoprotein
MKTLPLAALGLALALAGCMTPPRESVRSEMREAASLGLGELAAPSVTEAWWKAYGDTQLDGLMQQALDGNPSLGQALARVRAAEAQAEAAGARLGPELSLDGQATRQRFSRDDIIPPPYGGGVHTEGRIGFNAGWNLDFWGKQAARLRAAESGALAARLDLAAAREALSGAVLQAYVELDRQYALGDLAERSVAQRRQLLYLAQRRAAAGLDTSLDVRQAEAAVPQAQLERRQAQADLERAVHRLAALSGAGAEAYAAIGRPTWQLDTALALPAALPADLLGRRPDVLAARSRVEAALAGRDAARAAYYPDISLSAFVGSAAIGAGNFLKTASATYGIGPALHLPLFDGGALDAHYRGAVADIDARIADYDASVLGAVRDVADLLTRLAALDDQRAQAQQALDAAEAAWRLATQRYQAGLASYVTVLAAETPVLAARRQAVELHAAQAAARAALRIAVGGSFEPPAAPALAAQ